MPTCLNNIRINGTVTICPDFTRNNIGSVTHTLPPSVEAGSYQDFRLAYTAGYFGIDDSGSIKICWRYAADIGTPQFNDPSSPHYVSAQASNGTSLTLRYDPKDNVRPWGRTIQVKIENGFLREGDRIEVHFGDCTAGSPGIRMQTFCQTNFRFRVLVDPIATYCFQIVPDVRAITIVPGAPVRWRANIPTTGAPHTPFRLLVKAEDRWGNPTAAIPARFFLHPSRPVRGLPESIEIGDRELATSLEGLSVTDAGDIEIAFEPVKNNCGVPFSTNTLAIQDSLEKNHYWGDLHGQSKETIGSGSAEQYFTFARDLAGLDFAGHQGNDFQITGAFWEQLQELSRDFDDPGNFVTFPGYEWSGNTALGGDRNVLFLHEGEQIRRSSHALVDDSDLHTDCNHVTDLMAALRGRQALLISHVGGRYSDVSYHDRLQRSVEVHSSWGTFEWLLSDALKTKQRVGIVCNSDGHKGRPGSSYPGASEFGSYGGLTCILSPILTRAALWDALVHRHHYGTTGTRIHLDVQAKVHGFRLDDDPRTGTVERTPAEQVIMGDVIATDADEIELSFSVRGTAPLIRIDVCDGTEVLQTLRTYSATDLGRRLRVRWSGAAFRGRGRQVNWDGSLSVAGNSVKRVVGFNFLNPERQPLMRYDGSVAWQSVTTGGSSGIDCWLTGNGGHAEVVTQSVSGGIDIANLKVDEQIISGGGLSMELSFSRLPEKLSEHNLDASLRVQKRPGCENSLYIRVLQEDGHMAWSSPIYVVTG